MFTALIGPLFVDWTSYRDVFEKEASSYIGRPVHVSGKASVRLLPTPVLSFTNIRIGDAAEPDVNIERFRAEVELAPLLKGEVRIIQMAVERPRFALDIADLFAESTQLDRVWRVNPDRISLERLEIVEGEAIVTDRRTGRTWNIQDLDGVIEATSLLGPARAEASLAIDGEPVAVKAVLGRIAPNNAVTAKLAIGSPNYPVTLTTDGTLHFGGGESPKYVGVATVEGVPAKRKQEPRSPWADFRASGPFELVSTALAVEDLQISYGALERPLILQASGRLDFDREPSFDLSVRARQIDIDRALGSGAAEESVGIETAVGALLKALSDAPLPPMPGKLNLQAQGVMVGAGLIQAVEVDLASASDGWAVENLKAVLPGETQMALAGTLALTDTQSFRGHGSIASGRPAAFAAWWRGDAGTARQIGRFALEADLLLETDSQRLTDLVLSTRNGTVTGSVELTHFPDLDQLFANVDLSADRADLVEARAIAELFVGSGVTAGDIDQMTLSIDADVLTAGNVEARSVVIEGGLEAGRLDLRRLAIADLGGARIDAIGTIDDPFDTRSGRIEASVNADDLSAAAAFLASVLPESSLAARLASVAPVLSPVSADISAEVSGAGERLSIDLTGAFAETHLTLNGQGTGSLADPSTLSGTLRLHMDGEDTAAVLTQLGLNPLPVRSGPLQLDALFDGALASVGKLELKGAVAGVDLVYSAETTNREGRIALAGDFRADGANVDSVLLLGGVAIPGLGEGHAASAAGRLEIDADRFAVTLTEASLDEQTVGGTLTLELKPRLRLAGALDVDTVSLPMLVGLAAGSAPGLAGGAWSGTPFAATMPENVALDLSFSADSLDLGAPVAATAARLDYRLADGELHLDLSEAKLAGGTLKGSIAAAIKDGEAELSLRGGLTGGAVQALVWESNALPVASGTLDVSLDASARGRSMAGLVATLAGSGSFAISDGRLNALNPEALTAVMQAANGESDPDEEKARETFASLFRSGAFAFGRSAGSFSLESGRMTFATVSLIAKDATVLAEGALDLKSMTLASDWTVRTGSEAGEEIQPYVRLFFSGAMSDPDRQVDLDPLLEALRNRFLQRQLELLDELERERERVEAEKQAAATIDDVTVDGALIEITPDEAAAAVLDALPDEGAPPEITAPPALVAPPLELVPAEEKPSPPRQRQRRRSATAQPSPPATGTVERRPASELPAETYRTLPNGVVVKIR